MLPNEADMVTDECARVVQLLPNIRHGRLGIEFILYNGRIARIVRTQDVSVLPITPPRGRP
jgi:hypothetical protein